MTRTLRSENAFPEHIKILETVQKSNKKIVSKEAPEFDYFPSYIFRVHTQGEYSEYSNTLLFFFHSLCC